MRIKFFLHTCGNDKNFNLHYTGNVIKHLGFLLLIVGTIFLTGFGCRTEKSQFVTRKWTVDQAIKWNEEKGWLVGCNFIPSTAVNQLETWQAGTFDLKTMDKELGWAEQIGFNCVRIFLHHVAWETDKEGFKKRMNSYLEVAEKHGIKTVFVFFDDCWSPVYHAGKQPDPLPGVHNSGWVSDPGNLLFEDPALVTVLENYVKEILTAFKEDPRIVMWDLYNEPGNSDYGYRSLPLLKKVFEWAWEVRPSQPLTAPVWSNTLPELSGFQLENSDVITYHNYWEPLNHKEAIDTLKRYGRPLVCTEYMARPNNCTFQNTLPLLKENHIGAINWGLVTGKTNTKYAWHQPVPDGSEPKLWFHDIFWSDGIPYRQEEIDLIKKLTAD